MVPFYYPTFNDGWRHPGFNMEDIGMALPSTGFGNSLPVSSFKNFYLIRIAAFYQTAINYVHIFRPIFYHPHPLPIANSHTSADSSPNPPPFPHIHLPTNNLTNSQYHGKWKIASVNQTESNVYRILLPSAHHYARKSGNTILSYYVNLECWNVAITWLIWIN